MRSITRFSVRRKRILAALAILVITGLVAAQLRPVYSSPNVESRMVGSLSSGRPQEFGRPLSGEGEAQQGLEILLSEGAEQPEQVEQIPPAEAEPLASDDVQVVLDRMPPLEVEPTDVEEFRLPAETLPPPRPGTTVEQTFPPTATVAAPEEEVPSALEVLRYAPEGEVRLAPFVNVTFSQPMVPLATLEQLSAADIPVQITPELPGIWRWIGTKTLTFEYQGGEFDRFPMATEYVVEVPAGTMSAIGGELAETVRWTFTTPPPRLQYSEPNFGPQRRDTLLFASFDQLIDPAAVLESISVTAGGQEYPVRMATEEEIQANERITSLAQTAGEGRWLAFRAEEEFPADTTVVVNIGPGTPSAEGPLITTEVQSFSFQTYAPLRVTDNECSWGGSECPPLSPFNIYFNNPLDADLMAENSEAWVTVDPEIPGLVVQNFGSQISLMGATSGRTTYRVTLSAAMQDIFGQTLGEEVTLEFTTSSAPRYLTGPNQALVTLDPSSSAPVFTVYSINYERLRVRAYRVQPDDWPAYLEYLNQYYYDDPPDPPGESVLSSIFRIDAEPDKLTETAIDLSEALGGPTGHLIVIVDYPPNPLFGPDDDRPIVQSWVQATQIGLDAFTDNRQMVVWTNSLLDGKPLANVEVSLLDSGVEGVTGEDGTALLELPLAPAAILVGRMGDDVAILPPSYYYWNDYGFASESEQDTLHWYVFDDRQMYRPGEEVHIKGWMRTIGAGPTGDVGLTSGATSVRYQVIDPQGNQLDDGIADVNDLGGFDFAFTIPEGANLGYANVYLSVPGIAQVYGAEYYHYFQIQEFRRPEFEVAARPESEGPFFVGDEAVVSVNAAYFAGGPLPNAETTWNVTSSPGSYSPPNWPGFTFGVWVPWWYFSDDSVGGSSYQSYTGKTDASGSHYLRMQFVSADDPQPYSVSAEAVVMDVNRQAWAATTSLLVHPSELYVGMRSERTFVEKGQPLDIETIVTDIDGKAVSERTVEMRAARMVWKYVKGQWIEEEADVQECTITSAAEPVICTFETTEGGTYRISASVRDDRERLNRSELTRWVSGGQRPPARDVEQEEVILVPDKENYAPGETAEILVQAPFTPAEGLVTLSRSGFVSTERIRMDESTYVLQVPIQDEHIPNLYVTVDLVGAAARTGDDGEPVEDLPARPAFATGNLSLMIPPVSRTLTLTATPQETALEPGGETTIDLLVKDASGAPVTDAELAVVVVDEAILALTSYQLSDPIATFYQMRSSDIDSYYSRATIVLANPEALAADVAQGVTEAAMDRAAMPTAAAGAAAPAPAMAEESEAFAAEADTASQAQAQPQTPIEIRTNFNPLATWEPATRTDAEGRATVEVKLPDNLTRYRVMVVAVADGKYFGSAESNLVARLPLMVRPSAPHFLNFGDRFELPVVVQNQTDEAMTVDVVVEAGNIELLEGQGLRVEIPANDRREVRFPAATVSAGTARFQIAAVSGDHADAAAVELPVYTPATAEAFAVYGVVDEGAVAQPVASPTNVFPQFGGLEIGTSSTALQALTDAVLYLNAYPFECTEQIASRILGIAALRDVLTAFEAEGLPTPEEMEAAVVRDIERLRQLQNFDGGWPIWTKGRESVPFYSIHATHALQRARMKDFPVPEEMLQMALDHLRNIEQYYPYWYGPQTRQALSAYALYVRDLMGDVDTAKARNLLAEVPLEDHSLETIGWIWQVLSGDPASSEEVEEIRRFVNNQAVETAGAANFVTSYGDQEYLMLHSNRRTDAILLDAMIDDEPDSDLIPKLVNGLLGHRTNGRWSNTQENVFVLLALDRYYNTFESVTPDFVARMWLGDTYVGVHEYQGRTTETQQTEIPMAYLVDEELGGGETQDLIIEKDGEGRLYYRLGLRYAPDDLDLDPLDMGFVVQRIYEGVDNADDVRLDENGVWRIKLGARVRVRVTMVAQTRRYHVALVDPLPAGLETINPALAVSESIPQDPNDETAAYGWWWWGPWFEHQNLRDQRAEAFTTLLWEGVYNYSYVARATTPGEYVVPPAKAEEMYSPEVFGRSGTDRVIVE